MTGDLAQAGPDTQDGESRSRPLEPTGSELQLLLAAAGTYLRSVVDSLPDAPASQADPHLDELGPPELSVVTYRVRGEDPERAGRATAEVLRRVNAEQRVLLSSTRVHDRYVGRLAVLNHRTDRSRVLDATAALKRHAAEMAGESSLSSRPV